MMNTPIDEIIEGINKATAGYSNRGLSNLSDLNLDVVYGFQLLFGLTYPDPVSNDIAHYNMRIQRAIGDQRKPKSLAWAFDEMLILTTTLNELSTIYNANLNATSMINNIKFENGKFIYLAVTIVDIPIVTNR